MFRRYNGVDSPHLCLYWHYSRTSCHQFTVHLLQQEASVFKVTLGKNLIFSRKKASSVWNRVNSNDIDSKRSSSRSFHGRYSHPRVTGFVHAFSLSFIPSNNFFNSLNSKGTNWLLDALTWPLMRTQFVFRLFVWFVLTWCFCLLVCVRQVVVCSFVCLSFVIIRVTRKFGWINRWWNTRKRIFSDLPTSCLWSYNREPETQIIDYKTQQHKLLPGLAMAYASKFAFDHVWRSFQERQKKIAAGDLSILPEVK